MISEPVSVHDRSKRSTATFKRNVQLKHSTETFNRNIQPNTQGNREMPSDIEIAQKAKMLRVNAVAAKLGIPEESLEPYGHYKAKVSLDYVDTLKDKPNGRLILVTAISPTPAG